MESRARGMAELPFVITKHPIGGLKPQQVREKAEAMLATTIAAAVSQTAGGVAAS
jgi:hypothetical protein